MKDGPSPLAVELQARYARGDNDGVIAAGRGAMEAVSADADASLFVGLAFAGAGALADAARHLSNAHRMKPHDPGVKGALARVLLLDGKTQEAERLILELAAAARIDVMAALHLSDTYLQAGRTEDAFRLLSDAGARFDHPLLDPRLAEAAFRTRRAQVGVAAARRAVGRLGPHPSALNVAGPAALIAGDDVWLKKAVDEIGRLPPARAAAVFDLWANMLMAGDLLARALDSAERAAAMTGTAARWRLVCDLRLATRETSTAEAAAQAALSFDPKDAAALTLLARCRMISGDIAAARNILLDAVRADPACAVAFDYLTQLAPDAMTAGMAADLEESLSAGAILESERPKALLALARRNEAAGDPATSFAQVIEAKRIIAKADRDSGLGYRPEETDAAVERMKASFAAAAPSKMGPSAPRLVFIVGMPRSGTSLVEQILSSHSAVCGAGERPDMVEIMKEFDELAKSGAKAPALIAAHGDSWRTRYLSSLSPELRAAEVVTDKHPLNFWSIGLIRALFPGATIVNLRRSPTDVCLSILRFRFFAAYNFANEIEAVAHYYAAYDRMIAHWRRVFGDIRDVVYGTLVAEPEKATRALLADCGLGFEAACLEFHKTERAVLTHSAAQVREPINNRGAKRREIYGNTLKPLEEALRRYGVQPN